MANPPRSQPTQNLRFVVANDPDQFRDRSIMRNNRSHVMHNHLSEKRQSSSTSSSTAARKASDDIRIRKKGRAATPNRTGSPSIPSDMPRLERSLTDQIISSQEALAIYRRTADSKPRQRNTAISDVNSSGPLDMRGFTDTSGDSPSSSLGSPYASALASSNLFYPVDPRVIKYTRTMRRSTSPSGQWMHATGDPFHDPQRPEEAILTVEVFKDHCINRIRDCGAAFRMNDFSFDERMNYLGTLSLASPAISLDPKNFASIAASDGANAEAMEILGRSFSDPQARVSDMTLMAVLFLIERATITGDHTLAVVHEEGLKSVLNLRGSLDDLCPGLSMPILVILSLSAIARERRLDSFYTDYAEAKYNNIQFTSRSPHSPLLSPSSGFGILFDSAQCKYRTHNILSNACKITALAAEAAHLRNCDIVDPTFQMHVENVQRQRDIDGELNEVRAQISAVNNTKHDGDWVYESCRIATTLWAAATSQKVPLMEAAASLERKSVMEAPITKLVHAIKQTDISTCWDNMAGVLLWMTMIGGAAAKEQEEKSYLLAVSVRCIIVLMGEHKYALVDSMMKLLKVMQLWTDGRL